MSHESLFDVQQSTINECDRQITELRERCAFYEHTEDEIERARRMV
jgi:hypothetical protein